MLKCQKLNVSYPPDYANPYSPFPTSDRPDWLLCTRLSPIMNESKSTGLEEGDLHLKEGLFAAE